MLNVASSPGLHVMIMFGHFCMEGSPEGVIRKDALASLLISNQVTVLEILLFYGAQPQHSVGLAFRKGIIGLQPKMHLASSSFHVILREN